MKWKKRADQWKQLLSLILSGHKQRQAVDMNQWHVFVQIFIAAEHMTGKTCDWMNDKCKHDNHTGKYDDTGNALCV